MENHLLLILPILTPLLFAALGMILYKSRTAQRTTAIIGSAAQVAVTVLLFRRIWEEGIIAAQMGNWPAPFGISLVGDTFSGIMVLTVAVTSLAIFIYSLADIDKKREHYGYYPALNLLVMAVNGTLLTGDIFNMFVWFELTLISAFVLLSIGNTRQQLEGTIKYVIINLFSSALFLLAVGLLYGIVGSLNMADVAVKLESYENTGLITTISVLFMVSFGLKAAVFPLFFWLPSSYHTPPVAISAFFAGILTKVAIYVLARYYTLIFVQDVGYTHTILLWIGGLTMVIGVLGAAAQYEFRKILSIHIVSQIGYMIMGIALFTPMALLGTVFFVVNQIFVKMNLFLISGIANRLGGSFELKELGGLYKNYLWLGVLFLISAFSLAGFPPLSGFWAKFTLVYAGLEIQAWVIVGVALGVSLLTLFSMVKIWAFAFWKALPEGHPADTRDYQKRISTRDLILLAAPVVFLALLTVVIGVFPEYLYAVSERAAEQLMGRTEYIETVLQP
ncbi:MAG: multicomponent Na+:H+ antiporter subunit MnhD [Bacteroidetes bacterium HLUCCA01]|nr:MAG: multicomponent Na+:H+ antiporter subunit MnhD [Bacteroidetes bacterium HLUCCA01]